ncbi:TPA: hypothetical protein ACWSVM_005027 [Escherichia coli]
MEDFHLLVVLQPPQLKNSASHGATRQSRRYAPVTALRAMPGAHMQRAPM